MKDKNIDILVEEAGGIDKFDDAKALRLMTDKLLAGSMFYNWTELSEGWLRRESKGHAESWVDSEPQNVHFCKPLAFLSQLVGRKNSALYTGHAKDGECALCHAPEPK